jgi:uracil phosphoribosyltransferase
LQIGGSLIHSINELHKLGMKKIVVASLVSVPEGLKKVMNKFKSIKIITHAQSIAG